MPDEIRFQDAGGRNADMRPPRRCVLRTDGPGRLCLGHERAPVYLTERHVANLRDRLTLWLETGRLTPEPLSESLQALWDAGGKGWDEVDDPEKHLED